MMEESQQASRSTSRNRELGRMGGLPVPGAKVQPQAKELEQVVLGAMMMEKAAVNAVIDVLQPESFYVEAHGEVFRAIQTLFNKSEPIDLLTVTEQLRLEGKLDMLGGSHRVAELTTRVASSANVEFHARIIAQKHIQRELIRVSNTIIEKAYDETGCEIAIVPRRQRGRFGFTTGQPLVDQRHDTLVPALDLTRELHHSLADVAL